MIEQRTDRDLLELAAKAAGVPAYWSTDGTIQARPIFVLCAGGAMGTMPYEVEWNPLKNDCDALRLAVDLRLSCMTHEDYGASANSLDGQFYGESDTNGSESRYAAIRRAITKAAAAIGEAHASLTSLPNYRPENISYQRGYRDGYDRRDAEVKAALL